MCMLKLYTFYFAELNLADHSLLFLILPPCIIASFLTNAYWVLPMYKWQIFHMAFLRTHNNTIHISLNFCWEVSPVKMFSQLEARLSMNFFIQWRTKSTDREAVESGSFLKGKKDLPHYNWSTLAFRRINEIKNFLKVAMERQTVVQIQLAFTQK